jgi:hypothetical protein
MARAVVACAALAMAAGCGISEMYPPPLTGGANGVGAAGGHTGTSGTAGHTGGNTVVGQNTGSITGFGNDGTQGGTPGGTPGGSSTGFGVTGIGVGTVGTPGGNTGTVGGNGSSTGFGFTNGGVVGTNGSGPGGNATGGGGCVGLYAACDPSVGCGCGNACVFDDVLDEDVCEQSCENNPCTDPKALCNGTSCALIPCGPGTGNGDYDGACSADGKGSDKDGTCIPIPTADAGSAYCELAGTSDTTCDPDATRSQPGSLCVIGDVCEHDPRRVNYSCFVLCDPEPGNGGNLLCQSEGYSFCLGFAPLGICF